MQKIKVSPKEQEIRHRLGEIHQVWDEMVEAGRDTAVIRSRYREIMDNELGPVVDITDKCRAGFMSVRRAAAELDCFVEDLTDDL